MVADDGADEPINVLTKILLDKQDRSKEGRDILSDRKFTQVGIAHEVFDEENMVILIFATDYVEDEPEYELPPGDLTELKKAFEALDIDGKGKLNIKQIMKTMDDMQFFRTDPTLYSIIKDLSDRDKCSWPKFAVYAKARMTDRESKEGLSTIKSQTITNETPSPSSYSPETLIKGSGIIYNSRYKSNLGKSMGSRLGIIGEKLITPGPGSYDHMNINKKGKYPSSILSNSILSSFSKDIRFKIVENNGNPGPNAYKLESMIKGNGIMSNSRYNINLGKSMGIKLNDLNKSTTPGPGAYEFFSDFEGYVWICFSFKLYYWHSTSVAIFKNILIFYLKMGEFST